ncbi:GGDEF domain-containing protein [Marinobacterium sp. AK62]|uniref:diguanylate cyclase n=1 Tax=Marinobacterium alkalitolerans TaxID=1542925 RepID=A0ABS3ZCB7_9GAMM|nr:GGDEF domain-containing protein [Marinobacterium alkalitolerans]MBP0049341.1 GGDEF domain-containing protein [Marinobacterium alkalitolerans]
MLLRFIFLILPLFILPVPLLLEPWLTALGDAEKMLAGTLPALLAVVVVLLGLGLKHYRAVWLSLHLLLVGSVLQLLAAQPDENPARYTALLLASASLPLLQLLLLMLPERHLLSRYGLRRLILLFGPYATLLLLWHYAPLMLTEWLFTLPPSLLEYTFAGFTLSHGALAWNALLVFLCLGFVKYRPVDTVITIALTVAMLIGLSRPDTPLIGNSYHLLAQLMLVGTLIHHGYSMAFLDTLTGVPGRRALEHLLHSPGRRYVVAMLDIDHFKQFNDRYGHDTGDQVLRMVATQLSSVKAGGRLFRYGGEEFTIVFRGKQEGEALLALEQVRERVANYPLAIRDQGRPKDDTAGRQKRHNKEARKTVNVTISIGACENEPGETPEQVIKRADKALYLAKEQGRNCVRTGRERPRSRRRSRSDFAREAG